MLISTRATVHSALNLSHEVSNTTANVKENLRDDITTFLVLPQSSLPESPSSNLDAILLLIDSDDSVQDLHWTPMSKKRRVRLPSSDTVDEVQLSLITNDPISRENIPPPTDDEIEAQVRFTQINNKHGINIMHGNKKARVLEETYLGFKKLNDDKFNSCVKRPKQTMKPRCLHAKLITDPK